MVSVCVIHTSKEINVPSVGPLDLGFLPGYFIGVGDRDFWCILASPQVEKGFFLVEYFLARRASFFKIAGVVDTNRLRTEANNTHVVRIFNLIGIVHDVEFDVVVVHILGLIFGLVDESGSNWVSTGDSATGTLLDLERQAIQRHINFVLPRNELLQAADVSLTQDDGLIADLLAALVLQDVDFEGGTLGDGFSSEALPEVLPPPLGKMTLTLTLIKTMN